MENYYSLDLIQHLANSEIARNDSKKGYIEFLQNYYCETEIEKAIIEKVLSKSMSWATYKRKIAYIQNTLWLYEPCKEVKEKRIKQEWKKREKYSNNKSDLWIAIWRWFKN